MANGALPLLSALVLAYNHEHYIASSIKGLVSIDYPNMEICLLDDGSTDGTLAIVQTLAETALCPMRVETQAHSHGRTSENSQKLLQMARGKYLLFMSGDDTLAPDFAVSSTIARMEADENITMAFSRAAHLRMGNCSEISTIYTPEFRDLLRSGDPAQIYTGHLCKRVSRLFLQGTVVRKSFIDEFGGFDTTLLADDYAFMVRAFQAMQGRPKKIIFNEDNIWIYRDHAQNVHKNTVRQHDSVAEVVRKYIPPEHWPTFRMDYGIPKNFDDYRAICSHMIRYFGPVAEQKMIPRFAEGYVRFLLRKRDYGSLKRLLLWSKTRWQTRLYALRKPYILLYGLAADTFRPTA